MQTSLPKEELLPTCSLAPFYAFKDRQILILKILIEILLMLLPWMLIMFLGIKFLYSVAS